MDRIEMFGNIAHNIVPKVEHMLDGIDEAIAQPLEGLADATALCLEKMDDFILLKETSDEQCQEYMSDVMKLAVIAMSGHLYLLGGASTASKVANQMVDTYKRKNSDYGDSFGASLDKYGPVAAHVRMSDKINRLQSLVVRKQTAQVKDESIADTFLDLACYAIMRLVYIEMKSAEIEEGKEAAMSNIYYPESWMQHPEVLRLQQRVRELEKQLEFCECEQKKKIEYWRRVCDTTNSDLREYIHRATSFEAKCKGAQEEIQKLEQQIETFNQLSFIRKATFHFRID